DADGDAPRRRVHSHGDQLQVRPGERGVDGGRGGTARGSLAHRLGASVRAGALAAGVVTGVSREVFESLRAEIHDRCFAPSPDAARRIGAEVEFLALDALTRAPVALDAFDRGLLALVRRHARA